MRGIPFTSEMTLANLEGRKSRTSRTTGLKKINEKPDEWELWGFIEGYLVADKQGYYCFQNKKSGFYEYIKCPYHGELYGKETWVTTFHGLDCLYKAGETSREMFPVNKWKSPMMMPEWASRYHIKITNIICQRIQDITEEDVQKEGIITSCVGIRNKFIVLWDLINFKTHPWSMNPWVWGIYYTVIKLVGYSGSRLSRSKNEADHHAANDK